MNDRAKALIMTVGLPGDQGGDVLDALELDLDALRPDCLVLIASKQSVANARRMIERSRLAADACEVVQLDSAHDMDEVFRRTNHAVQQLIERGFSADQIAINYTSGTKVMGSGAVLSAVYNKIMELRYITGLAAVRDAGRARHRILTTKPAAVFAYQDMIDAIGMMRDLRFQSARRMLERVAEDYLSPEDRRLHGSLGRLCGAYEEWDNFHPDRFEAVYPQVDFSAAALEPFQLHEEQAAVLRALIEEMRTNRPGPYILADLTNNAARRLLVGRPEDAYARLYRALEILAQWVLMRDFEIDTNDVDTRKIPPRDRVTYEALRSMEDGMVKIGMRKAYDLLVILETKVGGEFQRNPMIRELLEKRSASILAHGYTPADAAAAGAFLKQAGELFTSEIPEFADLTRRLQFPWLLERLAALRGGS